MIKAKHLRAYALLIVTTWCWGLNAIISRLAVGEISPMQLVTFRWLGVVLLLLIFARRQIIIDWPVLRRHLPFLFLMGSCGFTAFNALFYVAGHYTGAINIGILQGSIPIFVLFSTETDRPFGTSRLTGCERPSVRFSLLPLASAR